MGVGDIVHSCLIVHIWAYLPHYAKSGTANESPLALTSHHFAFAIETVMISYYYVLQLKLAGMDT
jgi:hypothetical protein